MEVGSLTLSSSLEKVLVVDDNQKLLLVVRDLLAKNGIEAVTVGNVKDALAYLEQETPGLILCDVMMPGVSGIDFHEQLRGISHLNSVPFVFLSAVSEQEDILKAKQAGCDDYITKPFQPEELLATVRGKLSSFKQRVQSEKERADAERKKIINALSHEFRTPLVSINSGAELLLYQHESLEDKQVKMLLRSIIRGGQRLQSLVNDFVLMQQIDSGQAKQLYQACRRARPLGALLDDALAEFYRKNAEQGLAPVEIKAKGQQKTEVQVYDVQVISALERILSNGLKFAGRDKPLNIELGLGDTYASIAVEDRGPGLPEKLHNEVFELFQQVNRGYHEQQGAGLGLSIANYFAKINGGTLLFSSPADGVGLRVEMRLPRG